jgi:hypothetical protein
VSGDKSESLISSFSLSLAPSLSVAGIESREDSLDDEARAKCCLETECKVDTLVGMTNGLTSLLSS